ncbi:putative ubiquitin-activating enzyme [Globisporangium polare]
MSAKAVTVGDVNETADGVRNLVNVTDNAMDVDQTGKIDEGLYSRQLYVMGHEAQMRMGAANVLIIGLNGLGVEIAKNIILAGVKSVTLHDDTPASHLDLSAQFYLTEKDIGQPRAKMSTVKLAELNPYVHVHHHSGEITEAFLTQFRTVVLVNSTLSEAKRINAICHAHSIAFVSTEARGVFGSVFCDFGDEFLISDRDGEQPVNCMVASISNSTLPIVTVSDDTRHQLETGDFVTFREIKGFPFLNECEARKVTVTGPFTFTLDPLDNEDTKRFANGTPSAGGYVTQVKQPLTVKFKSLSDALASPGEFLISDFAKLNRPELLHVAFQALDVYRAQNQGQYPTPGSLEDADKVYEIAVRLNKEASSVGHFAIDHIESDEAKKIVRALASGASGVISPMAAFLGGIVGQEALKACSGKFTPIQQFFYFDAVECLPEAVFLNNTAEFAPTGSRYDGQIVVFGKKLQEKIQNLNLFLVGAGAIGCEMLKNWAMMGVSTGKGSVIHITDMDTIEKSNLNRQFLFRSKDVQQAKSTVAGRAIKEMNPDVNVVSYVARVGGDSEDQFNDDFFESLSGVCTALDNVEARLYMDQRCLFYGLPMFESGTLGTKGNTQIVVPHKTENYGASRDPPEKSIPICTLKNFPNAIEHTLQWARDWFEGEFFQAPSDVNQYLSGPEFIKQLNDQQNTKLETLERLKQSLVDQRPASFEDCVSWARFKFEELFSNQIKQLLHNFPLDQVTTTGTPFWSGPKRPPTAITFDAHDSVHLDFVVAVANSRAKNYGIKGHHDRDSFIKTLAAIHVPEFAPREGVKIAASDAEMKEDSNAQRLDNPDAQAEHILGVLPAASSLAGYRMEPIEFDKDDDTHMEVIVATSNLRARSYKIPEADMHKSRFIAGKIIPAIATTTALVTGLVCFEFLKVFQDKSLDHYKNGFVNLALPLFTFSEPIEPKTTKTMLRGEEYKWTAWDRLEVTTGDITLKEFLAYFEKEYEAEISMLSYGVTILYAMYSQKSRSKERMAMKISELVETVTKKPIDAKLKYLILEVCAMDADGEDIELPYLRYHYRK